jgi:hypothetical protein
MQTRDMCRGMKLLFLTEIVSPLARVFDILGQVVELIESGPNIGLQAIQA